MLLALIGLIVAIASFIVGVNEYQTFHKDDSLDYVTVGLWQLGVAGGLNLILAGCKIWNALTALAAVAVSFLMPLIGLKLKKHEENTYWKDLEKHNEEVRQMELDREYPPALRKAIMNGKKYRAYEAFLRENGERVYRIVCGTSRAERKLDFSIKGVTGDTSASEFSFGVRVTYVAAGEPIPRYAGDPGWSTAYFFETEEGERKWTGDEKKMLIYLVESSLPAGKDKWKENSEYEYADFSRMPPYGPPAPELKNPY